MNWFRRGASRDPFTSAPLRAVLCSNLPGLHFTAEITIKWSTEAATDNETDDRRTRPNTTTRVDRLPSIDVRARSHLRRKAAQITKRCSVLDCDQASDEILLNLSSPTALPGLPAAEAWITEAILHSSPEDRERAREHLSAQRHEHLRTYRARTQAMAVRALLSDEGLAYAWWLTQRGEPTTSVLDELKEVSKRVAHMGVLPDAGPTTHDPVAHAASLVLSRLTTVNRDMLLDLFLRGADFFGQADPLEQVSETRLVGSDDSTWLDD
ncbi:hypothetical protein [Saccharothrix xinjiangensis]|uniref:Uncharacterized protein n=1 Tax=Saccharothrix xinjiangensis TaxID=204798 RepID=A0ABV9XVT3_9PSEU